MVLYPVSVKRNDYRGADARKRLSANQENRVAIELEKFINGLVKAQAEAVHTYSYEEIAAGTGQPLQVVRAMCMGIDAGNDNGFAVVRSGVTLEQAKALAV